MPTIPESLAPYLANWPGFAALFLLLVLVRILASARQHLKELRKRR